MAFSKIALLLSHQRIPPLHDYYIPDLVELCSLAASVRDHVEELTIPVGPVDRDPLTSFARFMEKRRPDLVGISCFTAGAISAREYAEIARHHGAFVVAGGYHPSALPEEMLASGVFDAVVRGEGERTFVELVRGAEFSEIAGLSFTNDEGIVHNPDRPLIEDLDELPLPMRELRPPRFGLSGLDYHTDTVYASRGCRAKCAFCANHLVGKTWRKRSNESVLAELLSIRPPRNRKPKIVKFWDPNFLTDPNRIEDLCELILANQLNLHFRFIAETRAEDVIRARDILAKMREAGFVRIGCGVESPNRETQKLLNKGLNLDNVQKAADLLTSNNMMFTKFLIVGHFNESAEDIMRYPDYALSHGVELQNTTFMMMTPYPGTPMAERFREKGLIKSSDWGLYNNFGAVIEPDGIPLLQMQALFSAASMQYTLFRQFLLRKPFKSVVNRVLEGLIFHVKTTQANPDFSRREVETSLWNALDATRGSKTRDFVPKRKRNFLDGRALWIHCRDRVPIVIELTGNGSLEHLTIRRADEPSRGDQPAKAVHLSIERVVALSTRVDVKAVAHDVLALNWNPRAFKLVWLPSLAWNLVRLSVAGLGMAAFHVAKRFDRRA